MLFRDDEGSAVLSLTFMLGLAIALLGGVASGSSAVMVFSAGLFVAAVSGLGLVRRRLRRRRLRPRSGRGARQSS